jgi:elongation factor P
MSEIIAAKDLRSGNTFLYKNNLYLVIENSFNKTAMREGIVKCKVKNLRTGSITVEVLTGEKLEKANVSTTKMSYSYNDGQNFVFMDNSTYETVEIPQSRLE